jgi:hypothetical protein
VFEKSQLHSTCSLKFWYLLHIIIMRDGHKTSWFLLLSLALLGPGLLSEIFQKSGYSLENALLTRKLQLLAKSSFPGFNKPV